MIDIEDIYVRQIAKWNLAEDNYNVLRDVQTRAIGIKGNNSPRVQYNPARIISTGAKMDSATIQHRKCFLCKNNRPIQQNSIRWGDYEVLVNPYPIFDRHLTIASRRHSPQRIYGNVGDMALLAQEMPGYTVFYNGPHSGASAPDHLHFQAVKSDDLPIYTEIPEYKSDTIAACSVFGSMGIIVIIADNAKGLQILFDRVYTSLPPSDDEPMLNLLVDECHGQLRAIVIPRKQHRPSFYGTGARQMILSPASIDLAGVFITPRKEDYEKLSSRKIKQVYQELCFNTEEVAEICEKCNREDVLTVSVGIMSDTNLEFKLHGTYLLDGDAVSGIVSLSNRGFKGEVTFVPVDDNAYIEIDDVTIGVNFHWQRRERQCFKGTIKIVKDSDQLVLINVIDIEDYLTSVISSEMSATSSLELLKAHAVISRSWVLAQIRSSNRKGSTTCQSDESASGEHIVWYDHDDHTLYDVCADDHCQRYQGITKASTPAVAEAINATRGQVLMYDGELCDARFSKCCGGMMEQFEYCWDDMNMPYLVARRDDIESQEMPDLRDEETARLWILSSPSAFCNTNDSNVLSQVLNGYDQETSDFYRWTVRYDNDYLSDLILRKTGIDFGHILDMEPVERGTSGRISRLKIVGKKTTLIIGKELEIRRALSETHLYSSAFVVERTDDDGFILYGAGWGHGVGLCQIGAAMMAEKGYDYRQILSHYYPGTTIEHVK